ncbi:ribonuclease H-like domain-containing protein [Kalaharituber pfeilii]|nr:ribonuclease H-like domain-containing protein [Kalaharituber pfeilii]
MTYNFRDGFSFTIQDPHDAYLASLPGGSVSCSASGIRVTPPRTFYPDEGTSWPGPFDPPNITRYEPDLQLSRLMFSAIHNPTTMLPGHGIAIKIDGSCHGNGTPHAKAAWGAYFGPGSRYNSNGRVAQSHAQTSQVAEILAAINAINIVKPVLDNLLQERRIVPDVVLVTDSEYLAKSMSEWVFGWMENGWVAENGRPVVNAGLLQRLHDRIEEVTEDGIDVKFWRVSREWVQEADRLANAALE